MEATGKKQLDMLHGPIWNKLPRFALPVAATAILEQLFNASDVAVVGNFTGSMRTACVAAVGANSPIIGLIVNLFIGIALGSNVIIAHAIGQGKPEDVHKAVHTSVVVAVLGGVLVALLGELIAAPLLSMLNVPAEVFPLALLYLRIYLAGMPVILLYNFEAAIFRSVGETKIPLIALASSGVLNVLLNLFFVAVLDMKVSGVAVATVISNAVSSVLLYIRLRRSTQVIHLEPKALGIDWATLGRILRIGLPAGIQSAVFSVSNIVIQSAINDLGTVVMAASSAAFNIEIITYDILNSFSQACTTFVGQNYGAGELKRCKKTLFLCLIEGVIALAAAIALLLFSGKTLLKLFNPDPDVVETGYIRLMLIMVSHHHDGLSDQPVRHGDSGIHRAFLLPPGATLRQAACCKSLKNSPAILSRVQGKLAAGRRRFYAGTFVFADAGCRHAGRRRSRADAAAAVARASKGAAGR